MLWTDLLSRLASHLKERVDSGVLSLVGPYQSVLQQLAALDVEVAKGAQVCARARWIEEGDTSRDSTSILSHLFDDCCVIDIWRYLHPSSSGYTWMHLDGSVFSRIDLVGCPYVWVPSVSSCEIILCPFSDHCAVLLCVTVPDVVPPGPRLWKLNTSILEESDYVRQIEILWSRWRDQKERFPSLAMWWEASKSRIKELSINYCCAKSSDNAVDRPSFQARFAP